MFYLLKAHIKVFLLTIAEVDIMVTGVLRIWRDILKRVFCQNCLIIIRIY